MPRGAPGAGLLETRAQGRSRAFGARGARGEEGAAAYWTCRGRDSSSKRGNLAAGPQGRDCQEEGEEPQSTPRAGPAVGLPSCGLSGRQAHPEFLWVLLSRVLLSGVLGWGPRPKLLAAPRAEARFPRAGA